jgi:Rrf2 family transcriptional regulator, iron-sulfur cluster assembly transcription factor
MRLSTKGRYALTAMIDLALREKRGPVPLAAISARQHISLSYLEQLFGKLRRHELVESTRGPGGGYSLRRKAEDITVANIIVAVDDDLERDDGEHGDLLADDSGSCMINDFWSRVNEKLLEHLSSISLHSLCEDQLARGVSVEEAPTKRAISSRPVVKRINVTGPNSVFALGRFSIEG